MDASNRIFGALVALAMLLVSVLGWHGCNLAHTEDMTCRAGPVSNNTDGCVRGHVELVSAQLVCQCPGGR